MGYDGDTRAWHDGKLLEKWNAQSTTVRLVDLWPANASSPTATHDEWIDLCESDVGV
jgi:hypothetical protein